MSWRASLCSGGLACIGFFVAAMSAFAVEPPAGSRNFSPPGYVPNYFSNESGPFHGGPAAQAAVPAPAPVASAAYSRPRPAVRQAGRRQAAVKGRVRVARGKAAMRRVAQSAAKRDGKTARSARAASRKVAERQIKARDKSRSAPVRNRRLAHSG